jgi:carbohydrate kinase (thermoresistant glucokinase family)
MRWAIVVMGVWGSGKSTVGEKLAQNLISVFLDGDDYHPQCNIDHMAKAQPLTDAMRWPWLDMPAQAVNTARQDAITVFACSALRKSYCDHLRAAIPELRVVFLDAPQYIIAVRLGTRHDHFMPAALLESQYATLELPQNPNVTVSVDQPISNIVKTLARLL